MKAPRVSKETLLVLDRFVKHPNEWLYGYHLSRETGLKSGTLYPILLRLEKCGLLEAKWETLEEGIPPRHTYRLTPEGLEWTRERLKGLAKFLPGWVPQPTALKV